MMVALATCTLVVVGARRVGRAFLFPAAEASGQTPRDFILHSLRARDGVPVRVLELPGPPGARVLVDFHTNRQTVEDRVDLARRLRDGGLGVVLVEYRGYGASRTAGAEPTEEGLYLDAEAALDMLSQRGIGAERIVLSGTSLGTGVAAEMALRRRCARLVLVAPYTSIPDLVTDVAPIVPARALLADHFDTLSKVAGIEVPTLVIHGDADEIVPYAMGERVARGIRHAQLLKVPGGRHGDLFARDGDRLLARIVELSLD
jgi:uncharacterized protein